MKPDPALDRVREVRRRISEQVGHDSRRLVEHYRQLQQQHLERLRSPIKPPPSGGEDAA